MIKSTKDIPNCFEIANHKIKIDVIDNDNNNYGSFDNVTNTIKIAKFIDGIQLSEEQILNTMWHEIFHVFQFYFNCTYDEAQAQVFANFMRQFIITVKK